MKNIICSIILIAICSASCREDDTNSDLGDRIEGEWLISNLLYESIEVLDRPNFENWQTLELTIAENDDGSIELTSNNSPDFNIFPTSTTWTQEGLTENVTYYRGSIEGEGIEETPFRDYDVQSNSKLHNTNPLCANHHWQAKAKLEIFIPPPPLWVLLPVLFFVL